MTTLSLKMYTILGAFAKCWKATGSFVMSVCLYVCMSVRMEHSAPTGRIFMELGISVFFDNPSRKFKVHWNLTTITVLYMQTDMCTFFITSRSVLLRMRNVSDKICREKQNTHFIINIFFRKSCPLWHNLEKYCRAEHATDDNMAQEHCTPDTSGYRHTPTICNSYCFSTATMVARTPLRSVRRYSTLPVVLHARHLSSSCLGSRRYRRLRAFRP